MADRKTPGSHLNQKRLFASPLHAVLLGAQLRFDLYWQNPFRLLGASARIDAKTRDSLIQRFSDRFKLNPKAALRQSMDLGYSFRDMHPENLLNNVKRLRDARYRLVWELFWPHLPNDQVSELVKSGGFCQPTLPLLDDMEKTGEGVLVPVIYRHARAIIFQNMALAAELSEDQVVREGAAEHWRPALQHWLAVIQENEFWDYIKQRAEHLDDPRLRAEAVVQLKDGLSSAVLAFNANLAQAYTETEHTQDAARHLRLLAQSGFPEQDREKAVVTCVGELVDDRLSSLIHQIEQEIEKHGSKAFYRQFEAWSNPILEQVFAFLSFLRQDLGVKWDSLKQTGFDNLVEKLLQAVNIRLDFEKCREQALLYSYVLSQRLSELPLSSSLERKLEDAKREDKGYLYKAFYEGEEGQLAGLPDPGECWFVKGETADPDSSLVLPVHKVLSPYERYRIGKVIVPRSELAKFFHEGRINLEQMNERRSLVGQDSDLARDMEQLREEGEEEQAKIEAEKQAELALVVQPYEQRLLKHDESVAEEVQWLQTSVKKVEDRYAGLVSKEEENAEAEKNRVVKEFEPLLAHEEEKALEWEKEREQEVQSHLNEAAAQRDERQKQVEQIHREATEKAENALDTALQNIEEIWFPRIKRAEQKQQSGRRWVGWFGEVLTISTLAACSSIAASVPVVNRLAFQYLAPLEWLLRDHLYLSDRLAMQLPAISFGLTGVVLALLAVSWSRTRRGNALNRVMSACLQARRPAIQAKKQSCDQADIEKKAGLEKSNSDFISAKKMLEQERQAISKEQQIRLADATKDINRHRDEQIQAIVDRYRKQRLILEQERDQETKSDRYRLEQIEKTREKIINERDQITDAVKARHNEILKHKQASRSKQLEELEQRRKKLLEKPKKISAKTDHPAYRKAIQKGYEDGEKPYWG